MKNTNDVKINRTFPQSLLFVIKRFGQDIFGLLFIIIGLISLLNTFDLTTGKLIDRWVELIFNWFGFGAYLFFVILLLIGAIILLRHLERFPRFDYKKLIILEMQLFSFSALLSSFGGFSASRANSGLDGGVVGWGMARLFRNLFGDFLTYPLLILLTLVLLISVFGLYKKIISILDQSFTKVLSTSLSNPNASNIYKGKESNEQQHDGYKGEITEENIQISLEKRDL
ncbi:MAG: hypothetical protein MUP85_02915, partial [Candidatus Lokiarchaeota archaeon]|nr:hypothetical protein [Candidatus Lokiarchaeota archaeon]